MDSKTDRPPSRPVGLCQDVYHTSSPGKKRSTSRPTRPCRDLCVCTSPRGHSGPHKCTDCGRTWD